MANLQISEFKSQFQNYTKGWSWEIKGLTDSQGRLYPLDSDTKVLSTIFELLCSPVVRSIAKTHGYIVETANQTTYPDFTLSLFDKDSEMQFIKGGYLNKDKRDKKDKIAVNLLKPLHRIAIDIKTTYLSDSMCFTLGGYNSFIRYETKNILYPYSSYDENWTLGFVYSKTNLFKAYDIETMPKPSEVFCPYKVKMFFVRPKHEISGLRAGSGNTKNIGSFKVGNPEDFVNKNGPFMRFTKSEEACNYFWKNYEKFVPPKKDGKKVPAVITTENDLISHKDFCDFGPILEVGDLSKKLPQSALDSQQE
jgi:hypothetical protein